MEPSDLTIEILRDIRDEIRQTHARLDARLDQTSERLEIGLSDVLRRIIDSEIRASTAIVDIAGSVRAMATALRAQHDLGPRVERCERDMEALRRKVGED